MSTFKCVLVVLAIALATADVRAQEAPTNGRVPYSALEIAVGVEQHMSTGRLADFWTPQPAARIEAWMPFHLGAVGVHGATGRFEARDEAQPGFRAIMIGIDWRFAVTPHERLRAFAGFDAGDFLTIYDGEHPKGLGKESEIYFGAFAGAALVVLPGTRLNAGIRGMQVLTSTPIRVGSATLLVSHEFATPAWLRRVLE